MDICLFYLEREKVLVKFFVSLFVLYSIIVVVNVYLKMVIGYEKCFREVFKLSLGKKFLVNMLVNLNNFLLKCL